jgi:hypothetical protein
MSLRQIMAESAAAAAAAEAGGGAAEVGGVKSEPTAPSQTEVSKVVLLHLFCLLC